MEQIRTLVVDDEPLARRRVVDLLRGVADVAVVGEARDGEEALRQIRELEPDLVFLDIQMPGRSAFELLDALDPDAVPVVVFVTAFDEFALRAFDVHAIDYLLKPYHDTRLFDALERARGQLRHRERRQVEPRIESLLREMIPGRRSLQRLTIRVGEKMYLVRVSDIDWIGADGNYLDVHVGDRTYKIRDSLARLEPSLDPEQFLRIHRSTVVNLDRIREVQRMFRGSYLVVLQDGTRLASSRRYRERFSRLGLDDA